jgi:hypothetical protein
VLADRDVAAVVVVTIVIPTTDQDGATVPTPMMAAIPTVPFAVGAPVLAAVVIPVAVEVPLVAAAIAAALVDIEDLGRGRSGAEERRGQRESRR